MLKTEAEDAENVRDETTAHTIWKRTSQYQ